MRGGTWLIAAALALVAATPAKAAAPVDLGVGSNPSAVIDTAGTAHIVFNSGDGQTYCRLPRDGKACDVLTPLPLAGAWGELKILRRAADGALLIVQATPADVDDATHGVTWLRASPDNGAGWQDPVPIGTGVPRVDDVALATDGQSVLTVTADTGALLFQADPLAGRESRLLDINAPPGGSAAGGAVIQTPQGQVIALVDTVQRTLWRTFAGGDPYSQPAWQPLPAKAIGGESNPDLATGRRGTFLLNRRTIPAQRGPSAPFAIRSFDARRNRWRAPKAAAEDRTVFGVSALEQDGRGRLHLGWSSSSGRRSCVVYARTGTRSSSWFGRSTVLYRATSYALRPTGVAIAAGADGRGVAVWGNEGSETNPANGHVLVAPLKQRRGRYQRIRDSYDRPYC
jgi:hypothetical protein